jgi:hypothetical protein
LGVGNQSLPPDPRQGKKADTDDAAKRKQSKDRDHDKDDRTKLTGPARALQERLAAIDHLRDQALKTGNTRLLQEADALEAKARQQYAFEMAHGNRTPASQPSSAPPGPAASGIDNPGRQ